MADGDQDDSQKTEEPTQRRLEEAFKKGQVPFSRELTSFMMLLVLLIIVAWYSPFAAHYATMALRHYIEMPQDIIIDEVNYNKILWDVAKIGFFLMAVPAVLTIVAAIFSSFVQNGWVVSAEPITPKLEKVSPMKGLKRLFSMRSIVEFLKGIIKISIIGVVSVMVTLPELTVMHEIHTYAMADIVAVLLKLAVKLLFAVCIVMAAIALLDILYQRFEHKKSLRMTKQEIKDEYKQSEGNPEVKAKLRQLRMERSRKRMMSAVPNADVVITNPTHFAVALQYDSATHAAPILVAKGLDAVALRIRELAEENEVAIVENPPLARALYQAVEIDQQIPEEHFKAVAEVIAYVYKMKREKRRIA